MHAAPKPDATGAAYGEQSARGPYSAQKSAALGVHTAPGQRVGQAARRPYGAHANAITGPSGGAEPRAAGTAELADFLARIAAVRPDRDDIVMLCIGTDRSTGDAFGPLLGDRLLSSGWPHVVGTMRAPCDADRLPGLLASLPPGKTVVAFDACLGREASVGRYRVAAGPLRPAEAVGRALPAVGDYSVAAIVATRSAKPYHSLQSASLALVMEMAAEVQRAVDEAWGLAGCGCEGGSSNAAAGRGIYAANGQSDHEIERWNQDE